MNEAGPVPSAGSLGLAPRLVAAQALVLVAGAVTVWLVATAAGPGIFREHLLRSGGGRLPAEELHVEEAFASSLLIALGVALTSSVLLALAVTAFFTRRIQRSTRGVASSAAQIARGRFDFRVPDPGLGAEFEQLSSTINGLAQRLGDVEATRRRMLADLAHEMRTPLGTIEVHLEALEDGVRRLDAGTLAVLHGSTTRLRRLAEDVSAVSRAEEDGLDLRRSRTPVGRLVEAAVAAAREAYAVQDVGLETSVDPAVWVEADPDRMGEVLTNLLDNALQHTPPSGRVTVTGRLVDQEWVELVVTDTGEGIDPADLPHVFERFYRADPARSRSRGGSGIGLTICRALVEAHGGGISASSAGRGQGTAVVVRLPVSHG